MPGIAARHPVLAEMPDELPAVQVQHPGDMMVVVGHQHQIRVVGEMRTIHLKRCARLMRPGIMDIGT